MIGRYLRRKTQKATETQRHRQENQAPHSTDSRPPGNSLLGPGDTHPRPVAEPASYPLKRDKKRRARLFVLPVLFQLRLGWDWLLFFTGCSQACTPSSAIFGSTTIRYHLPASCTEKGEALFSRLHTIILRATEDSRAATYEDNTGTRVSCGA